MYQLNPLLERLDFNAKRDIEDDPSISGASGATKRVIDKHNKIRRYADQNYGKARWLTPLQNRRSFVKAKKDLKAMGEI